MTVRRPTWTLLGSDGRAFVSGLSRRAAQTLLRWMGRESEEGADDDELRRELRSHGVAQDAGGPLRGDSLEVERFVSEDSEPAPLDDMVDALDDEPEARLLDPVQLLQEGRILEGTIAQLEEALGTGALDDELDTLLDREEDGKDRVGARQAIEHRQHARLCLDVLDGTLDDLDRLIATGACDDHAEAMLSAEREGKARKGAIARLERLLAS